jgi:hypothetical protein
LTQLLFWNTAKNYDWSFLSIYRETTLFRPRPHQSYSFMPKLFKSFLKESSHGWYLYKPLTNENSDTMLVMLLEKDLGEQLNSPILLFLLKRGFGILILLKEGLTCKKLRTKSITCCGRLLLASMMGVKFGQPPTTLFGWLFGQRECPMPTISST